MTINEYQQLAMRTVNPDLDKKQMLINSVMGLCGESGEAIDLVIGPQHNGLPVTAIADGAFGIANLGNRPSIKTVSLPDTLKSIGLDVPYMTELSNLLKSEGLDIRNDILTVDEMVMELCQL